MRDLFNASVQTPRWLAVALNGDVCVTDLGSNRVVRFAANGALKGSWGGPGGRNGKFDGPWGIAVAAAGLVYVVDTRNRRVQAFIASGDFSAMITGSTPGDAYDVAGSPAGMVYITDSIAKSVPQIVPT